MDDLTILGDMLKRRAGEQALLRKQLTEAEDRAQLLRHEAEIKQKAVAVLLALQGDFRRRLQAAVGQVVSRGLSGVFGQPLELIVELDTVRELPSARFRLKDSSGLETDLMGARSGGFINVTSLLLRVLLQMAARPPLARVLLLDESLNNVSAEYQPALANLLRQLCDEAGWQILLNTHHAPLRDAVMQVCDLAYRFELGSDMLTRVTRISGGDDELAAEAGLAEIIQIGHHGK